MPSARQQTMIDAPVGRIWELVGDPNRHPEWWPRVIESECDEAAEGCAYRVVQKGPFGVEEHEFEIERLDDCREAHIRCLGTGAWARFALTEAQDSTFVDAEFGTAPTKMGDRVMRPSAADSSSAVGSRSHWTPFATRPPPPSPLRLQAPRPIPPPPARAAPPLPRAAPAGSSPSSRA